MAFADRDRIVPYLRSLLTGALDPSHELVAETYLVEASFGSEPAGLGHGGTALGFVEEQAHRPCPMVEDDVPSATRPRG